MKKEHNILSLTVIFGFASLALHGINRYISTFAKLSGSQKDEEPSYYNWRFGRIAYHSYGSGDPVLLIHDVHAGSSEFEWSNIVYEISKHNTVFTLDLLGYGKSEKPGVTYTNYLYVQLIHDFVKEIIKKPVNIVASGFFGSTAIMASLTNADDIKSLVLINPYSVKKLQKSPSIKDKLFKNIIDIPVFGTLLYHMIVSRETISNDLIEKTLYNPFSVDQILIDSYYSCSHGDSPYTKNAYTSYLCNYMNIDIKKALAKTEKEIFIIVGDEDTLINTAEEYQNINENINIYRIEKSNRLPHYEQPEAFIEVLKDII